MCGNCYGKLQALSPKLPSIIDQAQDGKDIAGERLRLTKQQETSEVNLTAKKAANMARTKVIKERQIVLEAEATAEAAAAAAVAAETFANNIEAIRRDCATVIEKNDKENEEIDEKLSKLTQRYEADFCTLHEMQAKQHLKEPIYKGKGRNQEAPAAPQVAPTPMVVTLYGIQAHLQATGVTSPEQLALVPQMMAIMNAMLAANPAQTPTPKDDSAITQDADADGVEAQAKIALKKERLAEEEEVLKLNASPAAPTYSAGKPGRQSDRVSPMQQA